MSYSYIKSVFPNFEVSSNYTDKLYNSLDFFLPAEGYKIQSVEKNEPVVIKPSHNGSQNFRNLTGASHITEGSKNFGRSKNFGNNGETSLTNFAKDVLKNSGSESFGKSVATVTDTKNQNSDKFEKFEDECKDLDCNAYIKHVMNCNKCKELFKKQLSLNNGEYDKQEIMELPSYIIFGIFIILLIDYIKKN